MDNFDQQYFIDGHSYWTNILKREDTVMLPALFFKNAGVNVDFNDQNCTYILNAEQLFLIFFKYTKEVLIYDGDVWERESIKVCPLEKNNDLYIPLDYIAKKFNWNIVYNEQISRTYIITSSSSFKLSTAIYRLDTNKKSIAITFDDGPSMHNTEKILNILKHFNVKATFFLLGKYVKKFPRVVKRIKTEGHQIGNHSWTHNKFSHMTTSTLKKEIYDTEQEIKSVIGYGTDILRPPYGDFTAADTNIIDQLGFKTIMWSVETEDWKKNVTEKEILARILRDKSPGSIILFHCSDYCNTTVKVLSEVISKLRQDGYEFVTLEDL